VAKQRVKHTDGTSWLRSGATRALWTIATAVATVFKILPDGRRETLVPLFGDKIGILISDRAKVLTFWAMECRQICWAHLLRKFISFSERDGPAGALGRELLDYAGLVFAYWHEYKTGVLTRSALKERIAPVREHFEASLARAATAGIARLSGSCADIQEHKAALWTFVDADDVEPTNNHAERELRAFVLWRKRSFGAQSDRGDVFAERLMTVAQTARKQRRNVLGFIEACCIAWRERIPAPSLFTPDVSST
jgi:transposase